MMARLTVFCAVTGFALAVIFPFIAGAFHPGYDHARQFISELGADGAPNAMMVNLLGFLPAGLLLTIFPWLAWRELPRKGLTGLGLIGVAIYAFGYVAAAIFPCDAGCRPEEPSTAQTLHNLIGLTGYLLAPLALWLLAWQARQWPNGRPVAITGWAGGLAALAGVVSFSPDFAYAGLSQRLIEGGMLAWILACGLYIGAQTRRRAADMPR